MPEGFTNHEQEILRHLRAALAMAGSVEWPHGSLFSAEFVSSVNSARAAIAAVLASRISEDQFLNAR